MRRETKHKKTLNMICRDERLSPNRRLLAEMISLWIDSEEPNEKGILLSLIQSNFGSSQKTYWLDGNNSALPANAMELEASQKLKDYFAAIEKGEEPIEPDEIFTT